MPTPIDVSGFDAHWTFSPSAGIVGDGPNMQSAWGYRGAVPSPSNIGLCRSTGTISQTFTVAVAGVHTVAFQAQLGWWGTPPSTGHQSYIVKVDGVSIGTSSGVSQFAWTARSHTTASLAVGVHTLSFEGQSLDPNDQFFLDSVTITDGGGNPVTLLNPGFDTFTLSDEYVLNPPAVAVPTLRLVATVSTCGKLLECNLTSIGSGSSAQVKQINEAPILFLNGVNRGAIRALDATFPMASTAAHSTFLVALPAGVTAAAGDAATLSAQQGWVFGTSGYAEAMSGQAASNRVGRSFVRLADAPRTMSLGASFYFMGEWHVGLLQNNLVKRAAYWVPSNVSEDAGHKPLVLASPSTGTPLIDTHGTVSNIDDTGLPTEPGYYAVRYDDKDGHSSAGLYGGGAVNTSAVEDSSLGYPGVGGIGKVRIFNFQFSGVTDYTSNQNQALTNLQVWLSLSTTNPLNTGLGGYPIAIDNVAVLGPGNFDLASVAANGIPMPAWDELAAEIKAKLPTNLPFGPFRMATVGVQLGQSSICEREHIVDPSHFHWNYDARTANQIRYTSARPWTNAASPYIYDPLSGSPYPATLSSPIAASTSGAVETITISDALTAPVFAGLVLTIGSERLRVMDTPTTSAVSVMRGVESTTASAHVAGPITVSGRTPVAGLAAFGPNQRQVTELVTQSPHLLKTGQIVPMESPLGNDPTHPPFPAFHYTDGFGFYGTWFTNYHMPVYVTGPSTFVVTQPSPAPTSVPNSTLDGTYTLDPANSSSLLFLPEINSGATPFEMAATTAAKYPGAPARITFPMVASDDMVDGIWRDRVFPYLPADRLAYVEVGDEQWNNAGVPASYWYTQSYISYGVYTPYYWYGVRVARIRDRGRAIATALGRDPMLVQSTFNMQCAPGQASVLGGVLDFLAAHSATPDLVEIAPYYDHYPDPAIWKCYGAWDTDMLVDLLAWDFYRNASAGSRNWGGGQVHRTGDYWQAIDDWNKRQSPKGVVALGIYEYAPGLPWPVFGSTIAADMDATTNILVLSNDTVGGALATARNPLDDTPDDVNKVQPGTWLWIDPEWMTVVSRSGVTCTVNRAQGGTTAIGHTATFVNSASQVQRRGVRNDWLEGVRDVTLHPNYRIVHRDNLCRLQELGVTRCIPSSLDQNWPGGAAFADCHGFGQRPGNGDGTGGGKNNLACLARRGQPNSKPANVSQDASTDSTRMQAEIDFVRMPAGPTTPTTPVDAWGYYRTIGPLTNTVSWLDLTSANFSFSNAKSDGSDLRVYDLDAASFMPLWLMDFNATSRSGRVYFKVSNLTHSYRLYYGNSTATPVSAFAGVFDQGSGFDSDFGTLAQFAAGAGGSATVLGIPVGVDDGRNYRIWTIGEAPILSYAMLTAQGVADGSYTGVREFHLPIDADNLNRLAGPVGGKYYAFFARRSPVPTDKLDGWRGESASPEGPFGNFVQSYVAAGTVRLCYTNCTVKSGATYYQWISYGWDTGGAPTPGLTIYHRTSTDLLFWSAATKSLDPSIWTDGGLPVTDAGNAWVIKCADGVWWLVVEAEDLALGTGWKVYGATASSPTGPWTASNGGQPLLGADTWKVGGSANPKCFESSPGVYVIQFNGMIHTIAGSTTSNSDWAHAYAIASSRNGPFAEVPGMPVVGHVAPSYGFETSCFNWNSDGSDYYNVGQRYVPSSNDGAHWRLRSLRRPGGLLVSRDTNTATDSAHVGLVLGAGTFTVESRSILTAHKSTGATPLLLGLYDYAAVPAAGLGSAFTAAQRVRIFRWSHDFDEASDRGRGDITFQYVDAGGAVHYWIPGSPGSWQTTQIGRNILADHAREVVARIDDDGTNFRLTAAYADDGSLIAQASIAKASVQAFSAGRVCLVGDPFTDSWGVGMFLRYVQVRPYVASDPTIALGSEVARVPVSLPTPVDAWGYYRPIPAPTNIVSWVDLTPSTFDFTHAKPDGSDLRVYDLDAGAFLPVWLMDYSQSRLTGRVYFRVTDVSHSLRLYYGNPTAPPVSTFLRALSGVFDGGTGFDSDWGDLSLVTGGSGFVVQVPESAGPSDPRNFRVWNIAETPTLQYSDTGLGGNYTGVREMNLVRDPITNRPIQVGGQYYITFARRVKPAFGAADKLDSVIAHGPTVNGPWTGYNRFYAAPGTIRLCYPSSTLWIASANKYVCHLTYGWDTSGATTPGITSYALTSTDLITWSTPAVKAFDSSIFIDPSTGLPCTDNGNPWVIRCADGVYMLVTEGERAGSGASWSCFGATATDPINGPWTACNGGNALVRVGGVGAWDVNAVANPKVMQLADGSYILQYNGFSDNTVGNAQHGWATSPTRDGPWTKATFNPTTGRYVDSYGFETASLHLDTDGKTIVNFGQRFGDWSATPSLNEGSGTAKIYRLGALLSRGGLMVSPAAADAAALGRTLAAGNFTAESRSSFTAHRATSATPILLELVDSATMPAAQTSAAFESIRRVGIFRWSHDFAQGTTAGPGDVTFVYWDATGARRYWNGSAWMAAGASVGRNLPADHGREVLARIDDDGTNFYLSARYADDGTSISPNPVVIAKSLVKPFASGVRCAVAGDPATDSWGSGLFFRYVQVRPYAASDPVLSLGAETVVSTPTPTPTPGATRLLESGAARLLEDGGFRLFESAVAPGTGGPRLLEGGGVRLLEGGGFRLLEGTSVAVTFYSLSGPGAVPVGVASSPFTASLTGGSLALPVTITPHVAGVAGTFAPASVVIPAGSTSASFTFTPATPGTASISTTNDSSLVNPPAVTVVVTFAVLPATSYTLVGPSGATVGRPSSPFAVSLAGGILALPVTITPHVAGVAGTFTPATVVIPAGTVSGSFTFTPSAVGTATLSVTNDSSLTDPAAVTVACAAPLPPETFAGSPHVMFRPGPGPGFAKTFVPRRPPVRRVRRGR